MDKIIQAYLNLAKTAVAMDAPAYTDHLRKTATGVFGWEKSTASMLTVKPVGFEYHLAPPADNRDLVNTAEYGKQSVPPSPAMRTFADNVRNGRI
jgi:hypothetical protein